MKIVWRWSKIVKWNIETLTNNRFFILIFFIAWWTSRERPFICQECGRSFPLKRHLVTHSKFHAGERPFVCDECGESFAQENHLIMHSRFHGSLNPFVCADCGATFPRKFQLVNHGRIHGRVPHSCTVCGKEFLQKRTLVAHMRLYVYIGLIAYALLMLIFFVSFFSFFYCCTHPFIIIPCVLLGDILFEHFHGFSPMAAIYRKFIEMCRAVLSF